MFSFAARLAVTFIAATPTLAISAGQYNPYTDTTYFPAYDNHDPPDTVCDVTPTTDFGKCFCKDSMRQLLNTGVPEETRTYVGSTNTYTVPFYITETFAMRGGCSIPECKAGFVAMQGLGSDEGNNNAANCICSATKKYYEVVAAIQNGGTGLPGQEADWTETERATYKAFCGVQYCYDAMMAAHAAYPDLGIDFCTPFPDPSTLPPSPPAKLGWKMTLDMDVAGFEQIKPTFTENLEVLTKGGVTSLKVKGGSLAVDAEIEYESDAQAEMAMYDVKDLDAAAVGAQLGVTVLSVEAPEKCGSSCHGGGGDDDNTALIVGATVGGVAGLAILVLLGWLYFVKGKGAAGAAASRKDATHV